MKRNISKRRERNIGIDLLRICSANLVINYHIYLSAANSIRRKIPIISINDKICRLFAILNSHGVNCYGLISGAVGYGKHRYSNLLFLWFQVVFYNFIISKSIPICFRGYRTRPQTFEEIRKPLLYNNYWYFTAYFGIFFFFPLINRSVKYLSKKEFRLIIIGIFCVYSATQPYGIKDPFKLLEGFCGMWLLVMYIFGSYLGKYVLNKRKKSRIYFISLFSIFLLIVFFLWRQEMNGIRKFDEYYTILKNYHSPFMTIQSICVFLFFSQMRIKNKFLVKIICFLSPFSFSTFVFHFNPTIFYPVFIRNIKWTLLESPNRVLIKPHLYSLKVYLIGIWLGYITSILFNFLKIHNLCILIEKKILEFYDFLESKILSHQNRK